MEAFRTCGTRGSRAEGKPNVVPRTQDTGYRTQDTGLKTQDTEHKTQDTGHRKQDPGPMIWDTGYRIRDTGHGTQEEPLPCTQSNTDLEVALQQAP